MLVSLETEEDWMLIHCPYCNNKDIVRIPYLVNCYGNDAVPFYVEEFRKEHNECVKVLVKE